MSCILIIINLQIFVDRFLTMYNKISPSILEIYYFFQLHWELSINRLNKIHAWLNTMIIYRFTLLVNYIAYATHISDICSMYKFPKHIDFAKNKISLAHSKISLAHENCSL